MTSNRPSQYFNKYYFIIGIIFIWILSLSLILVPEWRLRVQTLFVSDQKKLLAQVSGALSGDGAIYSVLKYQTSRGILVEIIREDELVDRTYIPDRHDGFFTFNGQASRLALVDLDSQPGLEIIAPTYDEKLNAHLNVLKFSSETKTLQYLQDTEITKSF